MTDQDTGNPNKELSFDDLCNTQIDVYTEIRKIYDSYKKAKRISLNYIQTKLDSLEQLWKTFSTTDESIKAHAEKNEHHEYFINKFYEITHDWYKTIKESLTEKLNDQNLKKNPFKIQPPLPNLPVPLTPSLYQNNQPLTFEQEPSNTNPLGKIRLQESLLASMKNILNDIQLDSSSTASPIFLKTKLEQLTHYWHRFEKIHEELLLFAPENDNTREYSNNNLYGNAGNIFHSALVQIREKLGNIETLNTTCRNIYLQDAKSLIPTFNGNSKELHKFLSITDSIYEKLTTNEDNSYLFDIIHSKLSGAAYDTLKYNEIRNWPDLKQLLKDNFHTPSSRSTLLLKLTQMKQLPNELTKQFLKRVNMTLCHLYESTHLYTNDKLLLNSLLKDNENQAIKAIEDGLENIQLQTLAKVYKDKNFKAMLEYLNQEALRIEQNIKINSQKFTHTVMTDTNTRYRSYNAPNTYNNQNFRNNTLTTPKPQKKKSFRKRNIVIIATDQDT